MLKHLTCFHKSRNEITKLLFQFELPTSVLEVEYSFKTLTSYLLAGKKFRHAGFVLRGSVLSIQCLFILLGQGLFQLQDLQLKCLYLRIRCGVGLTRFMAEEIANLYKPKDAEEWLWKAYYSRIRVKKKKTKHRL